MGYECKRGTVWGGKHQDGEGQTERVLEGGEN
jgi:hypothetical protein